LKLRNKLTIYSFLTLVFAILAMPLLSPAPALALNSDSKLNEKRANLYAAHWCFENSAMWKTQDNKLSADLAGAYTDLFSAEGHKNKAVVGFVLAPAGVINCETAVLNGLDWTGSWANQDDIKKYVILRLTGQKFNEGLKITAHPADVANNAKAVGDEIWNNDISKIEEPADNVRRALVMPLVNLCFTPITDGSQSVRENRGDFEVPNLAVFAQRDDFQPSQAPGLSTDAGQYYLGGSEGVALGFSDKGVGLNSVVSRGNWQQDNTNNSSDFYPLGRDFTGIDNYLQQSIVDCNYVKNNAPWIFQNVQVVDGKVALKPENGTPPGLGDPSASSSANGGDTSTCPLSSGPLSWILCPVIDLVQEGIKAIMEKVVVPLLVVPPLSSETTNPIHQLWSNFLALSDALLVLVFLFMIFSTVASFGAESYTVKRVLPRIIIAAILIQFSFLLCSLLVDVGNVVGTGIAGIATQVAKGANVDGSSDPEGIAKAISLALTGAGAAGIAIAIGIPAILLFLLSAIIAAFSALVTLALRILILNVLIIVSPLAFAAWVLPNTDGLFKKWLSLIIKLVMMYPMIILIFSISVILSSVSAAPGTSSIAQVVAGFFPIVALMMIPWTFKWAGAGLTAIQSGSSKLMRGATSPVDKSLQRKKSTRDANRLADGQLKAFGRYNKGVEQGGIRGRLNQKRAQWATGNTGSGASAERRMLSGAEKVEQEQVKDEALRLTRQLQAEGDTTKHQAILAKATQSKSVPERQAAMEMMVDRKMYNESSAGAGDGLSQLVGNRSTAANNADRAWQQTLDKKRSDVAGSAGHLLASGNTLEERANKFASTVSADQLVTQHKSTLEVLDQETTLVTARSNVAGKYADILGSPTLKAKLKGDQVGPLSSF
jgi:hypothetical protein